MRTFFAVAVFLFFLTPCRSCDCESQQVNAASAAKYDFIFTGKVTAVSSCDGKAIVTFFVDTLFKGSSFAEATLEFDCSTDCQMSFSKNEQWIIYAEYVNYGEANVKFCSLSRKRLGAGIADYYAVAHGMTFEAEKEFLRKNFGVQSINVPDKQDDQHHELVRPDFRQMMWYFVAGLVVLVIIYFIVKKLFK
jgi:hypothetical protein